ncbi:hypothetical protein B7P43_G15115 [Cryptotermes secundus]|uniref:Uncharacterized protein n=1 Tax=Cryptotermes secundus TaxID=105785 RepID=A0A2J7QEC5_9NEOP|nr:hypothetical protein B7P43_G15115 [Cryptotermes secundus]
MLPPPALSNMTISKQRITAAEFMSVTPAIVNHIFAELQLHLSVMQRTTVLSIASVRTVTDANEP